MIQTTIVGAFPEFFMVRSSCVGSPTIGQTDERRSTGHEQGQSDFRIVRKPLRHRFSLAVLGTSEGGYVRGADPGRTLWPPLLVVRDENDARQRLGDTHQLRR